MECDRRSRRLAFLSGKYRSFLVILPPVLLVAWLAIVHQTATSAPPCRRCYEQGGVLPRFLSSHFFCPDEPGWDGEAGTWYWVRSPEEQKRVVAALYNRYCIRCHGVDGRGIWDIPDVPSFASARWQASRSDSRLAEIILEGRGAVMPRFRGSLTLEEACAMARYLRTFLPGSEASAPDTAIPEPPAIQPATPAAKPKASSKTSPSRPKVVEQ
jgi:hypothetical protein